MDKGIVREVDGKIIIEPLPITLRDYFAAHALAAIGTYYQTNLLPHKLAAQQAYLYADAMLAARREEG
jgi:hypothetical protein